MNSKILASVMTGALASYPASEVYLVLPLCHVANHLEPGRSCDLCCLISLTGVLYSAGRASLVVQLSGLGVQSNVLGTVFG